MIEARPRETLPKNLCPALTSSSGPKVAGPCACGGGNGCGWACCARTGAVQHISAATVTAARREAKIIKEPLASKFWPPLLNLTPTCTALGCVQCPLDSVVIGTNYDGTTAGKIRLAPRNGLFCRSGRLFRRFWPRFCRRCRDHRTGGGEPLFRPCDRGFRPRRLFHRARGHSGRA